MAAEAADKLQSDINVTPLVDVCLVLLIIFMVVTPLLQNGVSVQIPQADNPDKKPEGPKQKLIVVQYATPPAYYMDPKQFSKAEFQTALDELYQRNPRRTSSSRPTSASSTATSRKSSR